VAVLVVPAVAVAVLQGTPRLLPWPGLAWPQLCRTVQLSGERRRAALQLAGRALLTGMPAELSARPAPAAAGAPGPTSAALQPAAGSLAARGCGSYVPEKVVLYPGRNSVPGGNKPEITHKSRENNPMKQTYIPAAKITPYMSKTEEYYPDSPYCTRLPYRGRGLGQL